MNYIKTHKKEVLLISIIVLIVVLLFVFIHTLMKKTKKNIWGNRVSDIKNHPVSNEEVEAFKNVLLKDGDVLNITYNLPVKTMRFICEVNSGVKRKDLELLLAKALEKLSDDVKSYYDIEVMFTSKDDESYPFSAYKNKTNTKFVFTNEVSEE